MTQNSLRAPPDSIRRRRPAFRSSNFKSLPPDNESRNLGSRSALNRSAAHVGTARAVRWVVVADLGAVVVALPTIAGEFGLSPTGAAWILAAFVGAALTAVAVGGALESRIGRHSFVLAGALALGAGSALSSLAPDPAVLTVGRIVAGFGAGALATSALLLDEQSPGPSGPAGRIVPAAVASTVGFAAGGAIVAWAGWRAIFWIEAAAAVAFAAWLLSRTRRSRDARLEDSRSAVRRDRTRRRAPKETNHGRRAPAPERRARRIARPAWAVVYILVVLFLLESPRIGLTLPTAAVSGCAALAMFACTGRRFIGVRPDETARNSRGIDVAIFAAVLAAVVSAMSASFAGQRILNLAPGEAGLSVLPLVVAFVLATPSGLRLRERRGIRLPVTLGCVVAVAGMAGIHALTLSSSYWNLATGLFVAGLGIGLIVSALPITGAGTAREIRSRSGPRSPAFVPLAGALAGVSVFAAAFAGNSTAELASLLDRARLAFDGSLQSGLESMLVQPAGPLAWTDRFDAALRPRLDAILDEATMLGYHAAAFAGMVFLLLSAVACLLMVGPVRARSYSGDGSDNNKAWDNLRRSKSADDASSSGIDAPG